MNETCKKHNYMSPLTYVLKWKHQAVMKKQCGQDLGQKTMFFHPKIPKICVTWIKREKGTTTHPHRPMFKIWNENSKRLWSNSADKIWGKKRCFFHPKILKICVTWKKRTKSTTKSNARFDLENRKLPNLTLFRYFWVKNIVFCPKSCPPWSP